MRLSIDTGGTFTDLVVEDDLGGLSIVKRPTTPDDPVVGILEAIDAAAAAAGEMRAQFLARASTLIHATTHSLNALLTGRTARTALVTTAGHTDVLILREGGREHFNSREPYPGPYVPRSLTVGVRERVLSSGTVLQELDEAEARTVIRSLAHRDIEAISVCLLWSMVNPKHELAIGRLIVDELPDVPYTLSHQLTSGLREYRRASAAAIDASLKPLMGAYLSGLAGRLEQEGFTGRLLMVTSAGTLLDVAEVAAAPIHSIKSGPAMAPVAGRLFVETELNRRTAIVADTGGTSYDVSAVLDGSIPWTRETWLGKPYHSHITGFPSVDVKSYGAGGGSIASVDDGGLLRVGPDSAGADPGPVAYGLGGTSATFTDAAVVLGYIDPEDFLGGAMLLDAAAARDAVERDVARPLGVTSAEEAAASIVEVITEHMARAIEDTALRQGVDPASAVLVGGGGAAGLNMVKVARRVGASTVLIPQVSAALSAAGALMSDIGKDFVVSLPVRTSRFAPDRVNEALQALRVSATRFLDEVGTDAAERGIDFFGEGHYVREVWEIEVPISPPIQTTADVEQLREAFHVRHENLYAVRDEQADLELISWRARAWCRGVRARPAEARAVSSRRRALRTGRAFFPGLGMLETKFFALEQLASEEPVEGPAIITSAVTTTVIDPGASALLAPSGCLTIKLRETGRAAPVLLEQSVGR